MKLYSRAATGVCGTLAAIFVAALALPADAAIAVEGTAATLKWEHAEGPVLYYGVWIRSAGEDWSASASQVVLNRKVRLFGSNGEKVQVRVAAFGSSGDRGPFSDESAWIKFLGEGDPGGSGGGGTPPPPPPPPPPDDDPPPPPPPTSGGVTPIAVGLSNASGKNLDMVDAAFPFSRLFTLSLGQNPDGVNNKEARPVFCQLDSDSDLELVLGFGAASNGWVEVRDDETTGWSHWTWLQYSVAFSVGGETNPSCGDIDGDGYDEIVIGGHDGISVSGVLMVFEDATRGFALAQTPYGGGYLLTPQSGATATGTRPAVGDIDGDGRAEIVVGASDGSGGLMNVLDDANKNFAPHPDAPIPGGFLAVPITGSSGETRPSLCDHDGDGKAELVVGLNADEGGRLQLYNDADQGFAPQPGTANGVIETGWNGGTFPACGNLDGGSRSELVIGGEGDGWMLLLDDRQTNFAVIGGGWIDLGRPGLARPAMGY